jgi:hypothetical protein
MELMDWAVVVEEIVEDSRHLLVTEVQEYAS